MSETFGITKEETLAAIKAGDAAQKSFDTELKKAGAKVLEDVQKAGKLCRSTGLPSISERCIGKS